MAVAMWSQVPRTPASTGDGAPDRGLEESRDSIGVEVEVVAQGRQLSAMAIARGGPGSQAGTAWPGPRRPRMRG